MSDENPKLERIDPQPPLENCPACGTGRGSYHLDSCSLDCRRFRLWDGYVPPAWNPKDCHK